MIRKAKRNDKRHKAILQRYEEVFWLFRAFDGICLLFLKYKYILLFSGMLFNAFKMLISFGIIIFMMIIYKVQITINILVIIPILINLFLITFAVGSILMHYRVYVKDLSYIVDIVLRMLMYFSGTFYSLSQRIPWNRIQGQSVRQGKYCFIRNAAGFYREGNHGQNADYH